MTARVAPWTYRDDAALPDDGKRYQIHDGELWETAAPSTPHQILIGSLFTLLTGHVTPRDLGLVMLSPLDVILSDRPHETTVLQPDVVFIERARMEPLLHMRGVEGPPTLAVEIFSPSTAVIEGGVYRFVRRVSGDAPVDLPPFVDLGPVPVSLWPDFAIRP